MSTIINNPGDGSRDSSGTSMLIGVVIMIVIVGLFALYVLPSIQKAPTPESSTTEINVSLPDMPTSEPETTPAPTAQ